MIILAIVVAVLLVISLLRIGLVAEYSEDGFTADVAAAFLSFRVYPPKSKKKKEKIKKDTARSVTKKTGRLETLRGHLPAIGKALLKIKRRLRISELTVYYMAAAADPAAAALTFGAANAGLGLVLPLLENNFDIRKRDLRTAVDFTAAEPYIYVKAKISLAVWQAPSIVIGLARELAKDDGTKVKMRKAV
jgi:hypothetical protein